MRLVINAIFYDRRLSKDDEVLPSSSEAMLYIAMTRFMLRRPKAV